MTTRFATRLGLPSEDERSIGRPDIVRVREPAAGAEARTKGSLYLLAQVEGDDPGLSRAADAALAAIEHDYYYDLTGGVPVSLRRAVRLTNQRLFHERGRLGIPARSRIGLVAVVVHAREGYVARVGSPVAVLLRGGRIHELPPPPPAADAAPRMARRVSTSLGEALATEPYAWHGPLAPRDRIALVSRDVARALGPDELRRAFVRRAPGEAVDVLGQLFASRTGSAPGGIVALEVLEVPVTRATRELEPVHPAEHLAGLPEKSPVPWADAVAIRLKRAAAIPPSLGRACARAALRVLATAVAVVPRRRGALSTRVARTSSLRDGRRARLGLAGIMAVAAVGALGASVAGLPAARPTDAIPRATVARASIAEAATLLSAVGLRVAGADLVDRDPAAAATTLGEARVALDRARAAGVPVDRLSAMEARLEESLDRLHRVTRLADPSVVVDFDATFDDLEPVDMVAASDGSLWVLDDGRGRVLRVDPAAGSATVVYRAGQTSAPGEAPGDPWLMTTAATDVVVIDRDRRAWRIDLAELVPRRMALEGIERISPATTLVAALQHRPPLEIFNLYVVDGRSGEVSRWTPPPVIPVEYPDAPQPYLDAGPDLDPRLARDLRVDVNGWLLHAGTVTRIDFGTPRGQDEYSLDPPPDTDVRPRLDYRLLDGATVGDRELLYVYDAANARLLAFQRADGAFVRQWLSPTRGPDAGLLDDVRGLSVTSVSDGPPAAYLLTSDGVVRLVLE